MFKGELKGKTVIFVTHAIHYTQDCDHILVIKDGKLEEEGTYSALLQKNGFFKMLSMTKDNQEEKEKVPDKKPSVDVKDVAVKVPEDARKNTEEKGKITK